MCTWIFYKKGKERKGERKMKKLFKLLSLSIIGISVISLIGCTSSKNGAETGKNTKEKQVIIYSNADDEAVESMKKTLDNNGYSNKYIFQTFGTSELGGKILAEGKNIEADLITLSSFYIDTAQEQKNMFQDLNFEYTLLDDNDKKTYYAPITSQEGAIIINTKLLQENNLPKPNSLKDLTNPMYKNMVSVTDVKSSSTAWLLIQALVSQYNEEGAKEILSAIYENAGDHIENSGSAPLKKVRVGEVAIGFGLRQQAILSKKDGLPVDYIDPIEGNFSLTESVAVIEKGDKTNPLAQEIARCIIKNGREELQKYYPNAIYKEETTNSENASLYPKKFEEPLNIELLKRHQALSESSKN